LLMVYSKPKEEEFQEDVLRTKLISMSLF